MSLKTFQFFRNATVAQAVAPQTLNNSSVNGATLTNPGMEGREAVIIVNCGNIPASGQLEVKIQVRDKSTSTFEDALQHDGTSVLKFPDTLFADGGDGDNAVIFGTLDVDRLLHDWDTATDQTFDAWRVVVTGSGTQNVLVGVTVLYTDLYEMQEDVVDHLWPLQRKAA